MCVLVRVLPHRPHLCCLTALSDTRLGKKTLTGGKISAILLNHKTLETFFWKKARILLSCVQRVPILAILSVQICANSQISPHAPTTSHTPPCPSPQKSWQKTWPETQKTAHPCLPYKRYFLNLHTVRLRHAYSQPCSHLETISPPAGTHIYIYRKNSNNKHIHHSNEHRRYR